MYEDLLDIERCGSIVGVRGYQRLYIMYEEKRIPKEFREALRDTQLPQYALQSLYGLRRHHKHGIDLRETDLRTFTASNLDIQYSASVAGWPDSLLPAFTCSSLCPTKIEHLALRFNFSLYSLRSSPAKVRNSELGNPARSRPIRWQEDLWYTRQQIHNRLSKMYEHPVYYLI